jgi:hypothetical protein
MTRSSANDPRVARLDDDAPAAGRDQAGGGTHPGTHAALGRGRRDVTSLPQRAGAMLSCLAKHERGVALSPRAPRIANASELGIEVVLGHDTHLEFA